MEKLKIKMYKEMILGLIIGDVFFSFLIVFFFIMKFPLEAIVVLTIGLVVLVFITVTMATHTIYVYKDRFEVKSIVKTRKFYYKDIVVKQDNKGTRIMDLENKTIYGIPLKLDPQKVLYESYQTYIEEEKVSIKINNNIIGYNKRFLMFPILAIIVGIVFLVISGFAIYDIVNKTNYESGDELGISIMILMGISFTLGGIIGLLVCENFKIIIKENTIVIRNLLGKEKEYFIKDVRYNLDGPIIKIKLNDEIKKLNHYNLDNIDKLVSKLNEFNNFDNTL